MSAETLQPLNFRPMTAEDVGRVPVRCQGERFEIEARIRRLGASAILAFEGPQHVAQLQFRAYDPALRSPDGLWDPRYWGDFGETAPELPARTLNIFCYHVGQLDDTDRRDPRYQGRGIGTRLLDELLDWAERNRFEAIIAKGAPADRRVMSFMGGQPASVYVERGFKVVSTWVDPQLRHVIRERHIVGESDDIDEGARLSCCIRRL